MKRFILLLLLILVLPDLSAAELDVDMTIPLKNKDIYEADKLLTGVTWYERAQVTLTNPGMDKIQDIEVTVDVPLNMDIEVPVQEISDINAKGDRITVTIDEIPPESSVSFIFGVKPPGSIDYKKKVSFSIITSFKDTTGVLHTTDHIHKVEIAPPPSWITYVTIIISLLVLAIVLIIARKYHVLEWFTTIDLITIAMIAALIGVVFRWFWQTFNDILGPLGGLLFTIPTTVLLLIALQLVRKPGTATLLFMVVELVALIVWGTNIIVWMGWYMMEGVLVDVLVILFKRDYGDRRSTAMIYGIARGAFSYWTFYFLFAPVVWKVYYAPWYGWTEVGIAAIGGLIGGAIGYSIAGKMRGAMI